MTTALYILAIMTPWLVYLSWSDVKYRRLPNLWTLGMLTFALIARLMTGGIPYLMNGLVAGLICGGFLLLPFLLRGAGGGDVKMLAAVGAMLGTGRTPFFLFVMSVSGVVLVIIMLICKQSDPARLKHYFLTLFWWKYDRVAGKASLPAKDTEKSRVPFGVAIAMGVWLTLGYEIFVYSGGLK